MTSAAAIDTITFSGAAVAVTVHGGGGADTYTLPDNYTNSITIGTDTATTIGTPSTGAANVVTGGTGSDSITFTTAIGTAGPGGAASIDGGAGDDYITLKAGAAEHVDIVGGLGADTIDLGAGHTTAVGAGNAVTIELGTGTGGTTAITSTADADTITNFIHGVDVMDLNAGSTAASTAAAVTAATIANSGNLVFDTAVDLGTNGVLISGYGSNSNVKYAVASDTGAIYYSADGSWTNGIQVGSMGVVSNLSATDFKLPAVAGAGTLLQITSADSAATITSILSGYTGAAATVLATGMDATQIAAVYAYDTEISAGGITGTLSVTAAEAAQTSFATALAAGALVTVSDTGTNITTNITGITTDIAKIDSISPSAGTIIGTATQLAAIAAALPASGTEGLTATAASTIQATTLYALVTSGVTDVTVTADPITSPSWAINGGDKLTLASTDLTGADAGTTTPASHHWSIQSGVLYWYDTANATVEQITITGTATSATVAAGVFTFA